MSGTSKLRKEPHQKQFHALQPLHENSRRTEAPAYCPNLLPHLKYSSFVAPAVEAVLTTGRGINVIPPSLSDCSLRLGAKNTRRTRFDVIWKRFAVHVKPHVSCTPLIHTSPADFRGGLTFYEALLSFAAILMKPREGLYGKDGPFQSAIERVQTPGSSGMSGPTRFLLRLPTWEEYGDVCDSRPTQRRRNAAGQPPQVVQTCCARSCCRPSEFDS